MSANELVLNCQCLKRIGNFTHIPVYYIYVYIYTSTYQHMNVHIYTMCVYNFTHSFHSPIIEVNFNFN